MGAAGAVSGVAVDRPAGRREHEAPHAGGPRGLEHHGGSTDVDGGVEGGVLDRPADVDLRGEVEDDLRALGPDDRAHRLHVGDARLVQPCAPVDRGVEVLTPPGGEVVAPLEECVDEVRADEAGPAGHERAHAARSLSVPRPGAPPCGPRWLPWSRGLAAKFPR
jgi:hypothetical protein